jgi:hypothetical protein
MTHSPRVLCLGRLTTVQLYADAGAVTPKRQVGYRCVGVPDAHNLAATRGVSVGINDVETQSQVHESPISGHAELRFNQIVIVGDRLGTEIQRFGDFKDGFRLGKHPKDLKFARREVIKQIAFIIETRHSEGLPDVLMARFPTATSRIARTS